MIHSQPRFILPLMHHLVQERVDCLGPTVTAHMTSGNYDLTQSSVMRTWCVMAEPPREPSRNLNLQRRERTAEVLEVELRMLCAESRGHRGIIGVLRRRPTRGRADRHGKFHDHGACRQTLRAIA